MGNGPIKVGVVGAGGHGREVAELILCIGREDPSVSLAGLFDDAVADIDATLLSRLGIQVLGSPEDVSAHGDSFVIGVGSPFARRMLADRLEGLSRPVTLRHPMTEVSSSATIGTGSLMFFGSVLGSDSSVGVHTHFNVRSLVGDGCAIGSFVSLSPGCIIESDVTLADEVFIGSGAIVCEGAQVGHGAVIGAGAIVRGAIQDHSTFVGVS
jgi:sugar O-acyltransferase (sialic acid O-acetyltransferase NeuD family)